MIIINIIILVIFIKAKNLEKGNYILKINTILYDSDFVNDKFEEEGKLNYENVKYYDGKFLNEKTWKRENILW